MELDRRLAGLMRRAQDGDRRAYHALLLEVASLVREFARRRLRQADWIEDLAQETLLSIHRDRHTWDPARPFLPWMYAIARHRLLDLVDKLRRRGAHEVPAEEGLLEVASPEGIVERGSPVSLLRQALALLSIRQRAIIRMLKLEGLTVAEIARETGLSESSVKVTAHRGYKQLRKLIAGAADAD